MLIFSFKCCTNLLFPCSFFVWKVQIHDCGHCQSLIVHKLLLHTSSCWLSDGPHPAGQKLWNFAQASHPILGTKKIISAWETQEFSMQWCKKYRTDLFPFSCINYSWKGISQLSFCSTSVNPKSSTLRFLYLLSMTRLRTLHDFAALPFLVLVHWCRVVLLREDREHGEKDKREGQGLFLPWKFQWIDSQKRRISSEIPVVWKLEDRSLPGKGAAGSAAMLESISCWEPAKISSCSHKIQMQSSTQQIYDADVKALIQRSDSWRKFPLTKWQVQWGLVASTLVVATLMYISYDALIYPQLSKSFGA